MPLKGGIAGKEAIINGLARSIADDLMQGKALKYAVKQQVILLLAFLPGLGLLLQFNGVLAQAHVDSIDVSVTNGGTNPTYQWYVNSNLIPGATSASFTNHEFFNNDSVYCLVTASGPCGGLTTSKYVIIRLLGVGVAQVSSAASDVRLVPNPNKGTFSVTGNLGTSIDQEVTLEVTNMLGQVIYTGKTRTQNGSINEHMQLGSNLPNGMYILDLRSGTEKSVFHFVIEQ